MIWRVEFKKHFLKELSKIPSEIRSKAEEVVFEDLACENPFDLGYIEQMKGYANKYKIRIGQYRIGIEVDKVNKTIICNRIAHRKDIYRFFP
jgi:mRNA interferase RelE/StbE